MNEQLEQIRQQINGTDEQLSRFFSQRMNLVTQVAKKKEEAGLPIYDPEREAQVLDRVSKTVGEKEAPYLRRVYQTLMDVSKDYERELMSPAVPVQQEIEDPVPSHPKVACQGVPGAFSGGQSGRM